MDDNEEGAFRRLQLRIRTLTTLLSELAPPDFVHDRMETMTMTRAATFTMLCNNVALLLNTSLTSDPIAVGPAAYTVPLGLALVGIVDHDEELPTSEIFQARQSASGGDESYIQSILNAFHPSGSEDRFSTIMPLMLAHCQHKIAQALSFSDTIFGRPLECILAECQPKEPETWESYVSIPESISHLMADIPHRSSRAPGSRDYRLASDTILQWTSVLSTQYTHLRDTFLDREGSDILNGRCLYFFLTSVMCSEPVLNTIFTRTDIIDRLMLVYTPPPSTLFAELGESISDCETIRGLPPAEQVNHYARACLSTSTSWRRAVIYLIVLHRVSRGPATSANMTFCLVRAPKPDSEMEDVGQLLRGLRVETKQREKLLGPREFKGTVHNEALLMALKTNTEEVDVGEDVKALFMYGDHDRSIGMAKKPCFCCHVVAEELNFKLPGTCGRILPWSPPRGINVDILRRLAYVLERKLEAVLR